MPEKPNKPKRKVGSWGKKQWNREGEQGRKTGDSLSGLIKLV